VGLDGRVDDGGVLLGLLGGGLRFLNPYELFLDLRGGHAFSGVAALFGFLFQEGSQHVFCYYLFLHFVALI